MLCDFGVVIVARSLLGHESFIVRSILRHISKVKIATAALENVGILIEAALRYASFISVAGTTLFNKSSQNISATVKCLVNLRDIRVAVSALNGFRIVVGANLIDY